MEMKTCSVCHRKMGFGSFHLTGRKRKTDGIMPLRAACTTCERRKARKRHDIIRKNRAIKKCPTCDNAMAAHGCGSRADLRANRARLYSGELLEFAREFKLMLEYLPRPLHPLVLSAGSQATVVLNKVMGRRWGEEEKRIEDSKQETDTDDDSYHLHQILTPSERQGM